MKCLSILYTFQITKSCAFVIIHNRLFFDQLFFSPKEKHFMDLLLLPSSHRIISYGAFSTPEDTELEITNVKSHINKSLFVKYCDSCRLHTNNVSHMDFGMRVCVCVCVYRTCQNLTSHILERHINLLVRSVHMFGV